MANKRNLRLPSALFSRLGTNKDCAIPSAQTGISNLDEPPLDENKSDRIVT